VTKQAQALFTNALTDAFGRHTWQQSRSGEVKTCREREKHDMTACFEGMCWPMSKTRTALQADERAFQESSFSLSFCLTLLVHQRVRLAADGVTQSRRQGRRIAGRERVISTILC
jgi:hypothetical protein